MTGRSLKDIEGFCPPTLKNPYGGPAAHVTYDLWILTYLKDDA
jgi:hypothetical protein